MQASYIQIITLIFFVLGTLLFSVYAYYLSLKKDKLWFYVYTMMLVILVQWMSDTGAALIYESYYLHLSSIIIFPSIIFSLIVIYIIHGVGSTKQMLATLMSGVLGYSISMLALYVLRATPNYIVMGMPWIANHFYSALALVIDVVILFIAWPILHNEKFKLPLLFKIWAICWLLLIADSLVFNLGTFSNNPDLGRIIQANFIICTTLSILISPLITLYLQSLKNLRHSELVYRSWDDITSGYDAQATKKIDELEALKTDLIEKNLDLESQRKALTNVLEDVQFEKDTVAKQAESLQKFEAASRQSNEMIVFTDSEGIVEWANKATEIITGFTNEETVGKKVGSLWGKLMPTEYYKKLWDTVKIDRTIFSSEIENHRKNGERFWSTISVFPIEDQNHNIKFLVGTQRDITREKQIDQMKTEFISLASHQLRTPLSAMKWFLEMLIAGDLGKLTQEQCKAVENIEQSNERMIALVNGLLNISRIESGRIIIDPVATDIKVLTDSVIADLKQKLDLKKQTLSIIQTEQLPIINIDPKLISQVIVNLVSNAIKYSPISSSIKISMEVKNDSLEYCVSDHGYGIPEDEQTKIFSRFFRASNIQKQETDGTGLGLYLAKIIIETSGGKIWFNSKVGQGTTFCFTIPLTGMQPKSGEVRLN
jgi:PAS domain S-box-containing protein